MAQAENFHQNISNHACHHPKVDPKVEIGKSSPEIFKSQLSDPTKLLVMTFKCMANSQSIFDKDRSQVEVVLVCVFFS